MNIHRSSFDKAQFSYCSCDDCTPISDVVLAFSGNVLLWTPADRPLPVGVTPGAVMKTFVPFALLLTCAIIALTSYVVLVLPALHNEQCLAASVLGEWVAGCGTT